MWAHREKPLSISQGKSPDQELNLLILWSLDSSASKTVRNRLCGLSRRHLWYFVTAIWAKTHNVYPYNGYRISICILYTRLFPVCYYLVLFFNYFYFFTLYCLPNIHFGKLSQFIWTESRLKEKNHVPWRFVCNHILVSFVYKWVFKSLVHYRALIDIDWMHKGRRSGIWNVCECPSSNSIDKDQKQVF